MGVISCICLILTVLFILFTLNICGSNLLTTSIHRSTRRTMVVIIKDTNEYGYAYETRNVCLNYRNVIN